MKTSSTDPAVLVGLDAPDDAAVYRIADDLALVQTVDFFTPIVDDPYAWGRIAAANAMSDVWAMGGRPVTALSLVAWPRALDFEILGRVLDGGADACVEADVTIVGGHSIDDPEPKYGFAVTGLVDPDKIVHKTGAKPGSDLVLTKPIGSGIISTGIKEGKTPPAVARAAEGVMAALNRDAAEAALAVGVEAGTDVTGFGLFGHLAEMLAGELSARLEFGSIPLIDGVLELASQGVLPAGSRRNVEAFEAVVRAPALQEAQRLVLFDAQTSGGLLLAVDPDRTRELVSELNARGISDAAVIGAVQEGDGSIEVV